MNKSAAYTAKEKILLCRLVRENSVVESKKTDGPTLAEKKKAWEIIGITFNAQPEANTLRSADQLRKLWTNLKQRRRVEVLAKRRSMMATGLPKKLEIDPLLQEIPKDAAPNLDVVVSFPWDSPALLEEEEAAEHVEDAAGIDESVAEEASLDEDVGSPEIATPFITGTRKSFVNSVVTERSLRARRALQQLELHHLKIRIAKEELKRAVQATQSQEKRAEVDLQKSRDEAEVAALKLKQFRENLRKNLQQFD